MVTLAVACCLWGYTGGGGRVDSGWWHVGFAVRWRGHIGFWEYNGGGVLIRGYNGGGVDSLGLQWRWHVDFWEYNGGGGGRVDFWGLGVWGHKGRGAKSCGGTMAGGIGQLEALRVLLISYTSPVC